MARALLLSRFGDFSLKPSSSCCLNIHPPLPSFSRRLLFLRRARESQPQGLFSSPAVLNCLVSGVDGGGVADDFVPTQKSGGPAGRREYSVLANVLRQIEPLDTSVIGKGVSTTAKDSMKRTISSMLGLLPSDQFHVTIRVLKQPLHRLLVSSIVTGYTLWNVEYRVSLMKNFDSSPDGTEASLLPQGSREELEEEKKERKDGDLAKGYCGDEEMIVFENLEHLSPAALNYIQQLQSELVTVEKELDAQEIRHMANNKEDNNDLLEYLRSLEPDMVTELSQPSSSEVEEIIQQLVHNIQTRFFKDEATGLWENQDSEKIDSHSKRKFDQCDAMDTTRDYLAKLLFWCMLLGHHMRGLEYRLHLSCVVGLL